MLKVSSNDCKALCESNVRVLMTFEVIESNDFVTYAYPDLREKKC